MTPAMAARITAMGGLNIVGFGSDSSKLVDEGEIIDDKDMYVDYSMHLMYDSAVMLESQMPAISSQSVESDLTSYTIGAKRIRLNGAPVVPPNYLQTPTSLPHLQHYLQGGFGTSTPDSSFGAHSIQQQQPVRKHKMRRDEVICLPRSLFDKQATNFVRIRRELKLQKLRCVTKGNDSDPFAMQKFFHSFSLNQIGQSTQPDSLVASLNKQLAYNDKLMACYNQEQLPSWTIQEEWAMLVILQHLQDIPVNLCILTPGHTPNWDFVSEVVGDVGFVFRSYKMCWYHFETVVQKREMTIDAAVQRQLSESAAHQQSAIGGASSATTASPIGPPPSKKSKKQNPIEVPTIAFKSSKTGDLLKRDKSIALSFTKRYQTIKQLRDKRTVPIRANFDSKDALAANMQLLAVTYNISYDSPMTPMQMAEKKRAMSHARYFSSRSTSGGAPVVSAPKVTPTK